MYKYLIVYIITEESTKNITTLGNSFAVYDHKIGEYEEEDINDLRRIIGDSNNTESSNVIILSIILLSEKIEVFQYLIVYKIINHPNEKLEQGSSDTGWGNEIIELDHMIGENDAATDIASIKTLISKKAHVKDYDIVILEMKPFPIR